MSGLKLSAISWLALIALSWLTACGSAATPVTPTATVITSVVPTLAARWKHFAGNGVSLSLPDTYTDYVKVIKAEGGPQATLAEAAQSNPDMYRLWLVDSTTLTSDPPVHVLISVLPGTNEPMDLKALLDSYARSASKQAQLGPAEKVVIGPHSGLRALIDVPEAGLTQVVCILQAGNRIYSVIYTAATDRLQDVLPVFEQSIQTFTPSPSP
ncbi:hypothetical protein TFLX_00063 [Thermoflexales bacterium]|nr:hypothetical protein TFLX_00063 [Thermoflexales bacterium]